MWPPPLVDEVRQAEPRHAHQAEHVRLDHLALVLVAATPRRDRARARGPALLTRMSMPPSSVERRLDEALGSSPRR